MLPANTSTLTIHGSYDDERKFIESIKNKYSNIDDIIGHNYEIYLQFRSYLNGYIKYNDLHTHNWMLRIIPHDMVKFNIELDYDDIENSNYDVKVTIKLSIGKYYIKHNVRCLNYIICDEVLMYCDGLRKLNANNNDNITTCSPFADTLEELNAEFDSAISDYGLKHCHNLRILNANGNYRITTCKPFVHTLEKLDASGNCGITDNGLKYCDNIKVLDARDNKKITTCNSFANTLNILNASGDCGITDDGIKDCHNIRIFDSTRNPKITRKQS